ncbi:methionyl-tRNA formyltransferase [bacterium]|nr:methionyl-tRNA formyltransferase [bacterium]MBU4560874.1 methionyl-tRNA formyltransferase [bacterium]MCG2677493.1 methionyl-tRNA formyltransferase [bacterium]
MKIIFMGTPEFACSSLLALIESKHNIVGIITQPDRRKGRGMNISLSPVKELALGHNLNIYQPSNINDPEFIDLLRKISPDLIVIVAFGRILSKEVLKLPKCGCINLHASLLPKYRGAAPIPWAILAGEEKTGVTTFYLSEEVDSGDIILQREEKIRADDTTATLSKRLAGMGAELLIETIDKIEGKEAPRIPQNKEKATYAPRLKKEDGFIDWQESASRIERLVWAMDPWPGAHTYFAGKLLKIWKAEETTGLKPQASGFKRPGKVIDITKEGMVVACGEGFLLIKEVQPPGKKRMSASSFASGYRIKTGDILSNKSEIRNPKSETNPNDQNSNVPNESSFGF